MNNLDDKKKQFQAMFLSGKYTQKEIADKLGVSRVSISHWVRDAPITSYIRIRKNLTKELEQLSEAPRGNEELIFKYIQHLDILDRMIRKASCAPKA